MIFRNAIRGTAIALPLLAATLLFTFSVVPAHASSGLLITNFYVTPFQAPVGAKATAIITIENLDNSNPATVTVTVSDGGIVVADNAHQPANIRTYGYATIQIQFKTATSSPHCYVATTAPIARSQGYCESGSTLLGGMPLMINQLLLIAPYVGIAVLASTLSIVFLRKRRI